jgi:hypothetical protein
VPRSPKAVLLSLETLTLDAWFGSGWPVPYVWTIFFVADGSTLSVTAAGKVAGVAQVFPTAGSREDLGSPQVEEGDSPHINAQQGMFSSALKPIPVDPSLQGLLGEDLPAQFGAIVVLMYQNGYFTDKLARAGEDGLNSYVTQAIADVIASIGPGHMTITQQDIDSLTSGANDAVQNAVENAASTWQEIQIFFDGHDDTLGHVTLLYSQDDFSGTDPTQEVTQEFGQSFDGGFSAWTLNGTVTVTDPCAADATISALQETFAGPGRPVSSQAEEVITSLRRWRDSGDVRLIPSAAWWWDVFSLHSAEIASLVARDPSVRDALIAVLPDLRQVLDLPDRPIPNSLLRSLSTVLTLLRRKGGPGLASTATLAQRAAAALPGKTFYQAEEAMAAQHLPPLTRD